MPAEVWIISPLSDLKCRCIVRISTDNLSQVLETHFYEDFFSDILKSNRGSFVEVLGVY